MMEDIYNNFYYLNRNPNWHQEDAPVKSDAVFKILEANKVLYSSVCEIGCGSGEILRLLQLKNAKEQIVYHGFDISAEAISLSLGKENQTLKFYRDDFAQRQVDKPYDVLLVLDVIEHLRDYFKFLENIRTKGRYTVFHIPLDMFVWSLFREEMLLESKSRVGHIHNFTEKFILSILHDTGYTVKDFQFTEPNYSSHSFKQKIVNTIKKFLFKISPRFCTKTLGGYSLLILCEN